MIQYVKNNAETVDLNIEKKNENADVQVEYDGKTYNDGKNIPVKVGKNYITVKSTVQEKWTDSNFNISCKCASPSSR